MKETIWISNCYFFHIDDETYEYDAYTNATYVNAATHETEQTSTSRNSKGTLS